MFKANNFLLLGSLLLSPALWAANLILPDNLSLLASDRGEPSKLKHTLDMPAGERHLLVRFDSPSDPHSANESQGRVTSAPLLITLNATSDGKLYLQTPALDTVAQVRDFARHPMLTLKDAQGTNVPFTLRKLPGSASLFTDYEALLAAEMSVTDQPLPTPTASGAPINPKTIHASELSPAQADALMRDLYRQADDSSRKAFMRWALDL